MKVTDLVNSLGFTPVCMPEPEREINGCYIGDLLSWVMGRAQADDLWITIMSNVNTVAVASLADVSAVLLAENVTLEASIVQTARQKGVNILSTPLPAYEAAVKLSGAL